RAGARAHCLRPPAAERRRCRRPWAFPSAAADRQECTVPGRRRARPRRRAKKGMEMTLRFGLSAVAVPGSRLFVSVKVLLAVSLCAATAWAAEVGGIYTEPSTKDLGEVTKIEVLKGIKFRGWIDTYFAGNFNDPRQSTVNANQSLS